MILIISSISRFGASVRRATGQESQTIATEPEALDDVLGTSDVSNLRLVVLGEDVPLAAAISMARSIRKVGQAQIVLVRFFPELAESVAKDAQIDYVQAADLPEEQVHEFVRAILAEEGRPSESHVEDDVNVAAPAEQDTAPDGFVPEEPVIEEQAPEEPVIEGDGIAVDEEREVEDEPRPFADYEPDPHTEELPLAEAVLTDTDVEPEAEAPEEHALADEKLPESPVRLIGSDEVDQLLVASDEPAAALQSNDVDAEQEQEAGALDLPEVTDLLAPEEHRVIVVFSPKGGVGKTTVSTNLAVALSTRAKHQTVLVDLDVQFGDVANALKINAEHAIDRAFTPNGVQQSLIVKGLLTSYHHDLFVLCAPDNPAAMEHTSAAQMTALMTQLSEDFGYVVVDTGAGLTEATLAALEVATDLVVVSSPDLSAIRAVRKTLELLQTLQLVPQNVLVFVNQLDPGVGLTEDDVAAALDRPVDAAVPRATEVALSMNTGEPIVLHKRTSAMTRAVNDLADRLTGVRTSRPKTGQTAKRRWFR